MTSYLGNFFNIIFLIFFFYKSVKISSLLGLFKKTNDQTPLVGGLGIYLFIIFGIINLYFFEFQLVKNYLNILLLVTAIFLIGLLDDILNISYKFRLISIFLILFVFFKFNEKFLIDQLYFESLNKTFVLKDLKYFITPLFIMLLLNSMNMADGINGNSGLIFLSYIFVLFETNNNLNFFLFLIIISLIIFLFFNFKNITYMGDSGIYLVSIFLSLYVINNYNYGNLDLSCEKIFLTFMIPGIDMFRLFCIRIFNKKNPFKGDLNHLHHLLVDNFNLKISLIVYILLILWPFIFIKLFNSSSINFILINILIYLILVIVLKNNKFRKVK